MTVPEFISLGAGVQSSTLALMAAHGEVEGRPIPSGAIFSDTQAEPPSVYAWLDELEAMIAEAPHPFPVYRVTAGNLATASLRRKKSAKTGKAYVRGQVPVFLKMPPGVSMLWRRCSRDFKIRPIQRKLRSLVNLPRRGREGLYCRSWIGISTDEASRMKPSRESWVENVWPLIDLGMSRADCIAWMEDRGMPRPPRSACVFCPYHSPAEWKRLRDVEPEAFKAAARWEKMLQRATMVDERMIGTPYLTRECVPLEEAKFGEDDSQMHLFDNECEGICGI